MFGLRDPTNFHTTSHEANGTWPQKIIIKLFSNGSKMIADECRYVPDRNSRWATKPERKPIILLLHLTRTGRVWRRIIGELTRYFGSCPSGRSVVICIAGEAFLLRNPVVIIIRIVTGVDF